MARGLFRATIRYEGAIPSNLSRRTFNKFCAEGYRILGIYWHQHFRQKHFTHAAIREYGYTPRKGEAGSGRKFRGSYTWRKLKKFGHTKPLTFTGESERLTRIRDVRANGKGCRVIIRANKFNFRAKGSHVNMRWEMTRISRKEGETLTKLFQNFMTRRLGQLPKTTWKI